jgi:23S rRNA (pseudouridine1915-N3)-methyltransferase
LQLHIIARGKIGRGPEAELVERYLKRIAWPVKVTELPESGGKTPGPAEHAVDILLDEKGEQLGSVDFAGRLERWRD